MFHKSLNVAVTGTRDTGKNGEWPVGETSRSRCSRSAGACPPRCPASRYVFRSFRGCYRHSGPTDLKSTKDVFSVARTLARDRPSPYGEVPFFPVARGPVPREHHRPDVCFRRCGLCSPDHKQFRIRRARTTGGAHLSLAALTPGGLSYREATEI